MKTTKPTQRLHFTNETLRALPPAAPGQRYRVVSMDDPGMVARVNDKGDVVLYLNRRPAGSTQPVMAKLVRFRLDRNGRGNLNEARRVYADKTKLLDAGRHPRHEQIKQVKRSFGEAAEAYIKASTADDFASR